LLGWDDLAPLVLSEGVVEVFSQFKSLIEACGGVAGEGTVVVGLHRHLKFLAVFGTLSSLHLIYR